MWSKRPMTSTTTTTTTTKTVEKKINNNNNNNIRLVPIATACIPPYLSRASSWPNQPSGNLWTRMIVLIVKAMTMKTMTMTMTMTMTTMTMTSETERQQIIATNK